MLKKIVLLVALSLSVASAISTAAVDSPPPGCYPCDGDGN